MSDIIWLEPEELILDTLAMRARLLSDVLTEYGVHADIEATRAAHRGVPTIVALESIAGGLALDHTARQLVSRVMADRVAETTAWVIPALHPDARESFAALASARRVQVLTRARGDTMHRWLEALELTEYVHRIVSVDDLPTDAVYARWVFATETGIAVLPRPAIASALADGVLLMDTLTPAAVHELLARSSTNCAP
jgi:phosphoglycolate phosphatase-like HAD superfamily hydrolase